jgi:hypothetical protein
MSSDYSKDLDDDECREDPDIAGYFQKPVLI